MPGIKRELKSRNENSGKDKLGDFVDKYRRYDNITKMSESKFIDHDCRWAEKKGYRQSRSKAATIYSMAKDGIPRLPANQTAKMPVHEAVEVLKRAKEALNTILARMKELAKNLPEYPVVRAMGDVEETLAPRLIADIGDVRRFHSSKALIAFAGSHINPVSLLVQNAIDPNVVHQLFVKPGMKSWDLLNHIKNPMIMLYTISFSRKKPRVNQRK